MKKVIVIVLLFSLLLTACGQNATAIKTKEPTPTEPITTKKPTPTPTPEPTETPTPTPAPTETPTPTPEPTETPTPTPEPTEPPKLPVTWPFSDNPSVDTQIRMYMVSDNEFDLIGFMDICYGLTYHEDHQTDVEKEIVFDDPCGAVIKILYDGRFDDIAPGAVGLGVEIWKGGEKKNEYCAIDATETLSDNDLTFTGALSNRPPINSRRLFKLLTTLPDVVTNVYFEHCPFFETHNVIHGESVDNCTTIVSYHEEGDENCH